MNKRALIIFIFLLVILIKPSISYAVQICEKSEEYEAYENLPEEERNKINPPAYCKFVYENNSLDNKVQATVSSSYYNAKDEGLVTSVKNQMSIGSCWAFSSISVVETNALKNGLPAYDFSEAHMLYTLLKGGYEVSDTAGRKGKYESESISIGGKPYYAPSYYFNNGGQLLESEMAYPGTPKTISSSSYINGNSMITLSTYELLNMSSYAACSTSEISLIKQKILDNGSVQGLMYYDNKTFSDNTYDYSLSTTADSSGTNHGVVIVGWDDTISKTKFKGATRDGAWIIKNSYGSTWSSDGYFYISYDDHFICKYVSAYSGVSNKKFDNSYKASDLISFTSGFNLMGTVYTSSKFSKTSSNEAIKRVSFAVGDNTDYEIYLSKNNNKTDTSSWVLLGSGHSDYISVRSIDISNVTIDDDFTIIVKHKNSISGQAEMLPAMCSTDVDVADQTYSTNTNFITTTPKAWQDLYDITGQDGSEIHCEPIIYVYTDNVASSGNESNIITPKDATKAKFANNILYLAIPKGTTVRTTTISSYISSSRPYSFVTPEGATYSGILGTGYKIKIDGVDYPIVILGDVTGDGSITSSDLLKIVKLLKGQTTLDTTKIKAADVTKDGNLTSSDLLKIVKYLKGNTTFTV